MFSNFLICLQIPKHFYTYFHHYHIFGLSKIIRFILKGRCSALNFISLRKHIFTHCHKTRTILCGIKTRKYHSTPFRKYASLRHAGGEYKKKLVQGQRISFHPKWHMAFGPSHTKSKHARIHTTSRAPT